MFTQALMVKGICANPSLSSRGVPGFGKIRLQDCTLTVQYSEFDFTFHCCGQHNKKQQQRVFFLRDSVPVTRENLQTSLSTVFTGITFH